MAKVAVALDTWDRPTFRHWLELFGHRTGVLKVGLEAFVRWGPPAVEEAAGAGAELFLDLKLHDIPNTVAGAAAAAADLGVRYLTVHASGGPAMLEAAVTAAGERCGVLAVTVLTHLDRIALEQLDLPGTADERVLRWAELAQEAGCAGIVCSPLELERLRPRLAPPFKLVTPGIRPLFAQSGEDDQRRVATPAQALEAGSDLLVIGRPLTRADDPEAALAALAEEIGG